MKVSIPWREERQNARWDDWDQSVNKMTGVALCLTMLRNISSLREHLAQKKGETEQKKGKKHLYRPPMK